MNEVENEQAFQNFKMEIAEIKKRDSTMFAIEDINNLEYKCFDLWERLKKIILNYSREQFEIDGRAFAEESYQNSMASTSKDAKEFYAWTRNLIQHVFSAAYFEGEEFEQEMKVIKKRIQG